jgi:hypothetical protein
MLKQILAGGAIFRDKVITGKPDIYASVSEDAMKMLDDASSKSTSFTSTTA